MASCVDAEARRCVLLQYYLYFWLLCWAVLSSDVFSYVISVMRIPVSSKNNTTVYQYAVLPFQYVDFRVV